MIAEKKYLRPVSVEEAVLLAKANENDFRYLAGGTDLLVNKFQGNETAGCLIDITSIEELKNINTDGSQLKIGSLVRLDDLRKNEVIRNLFPALIQAAHSAASPVIRKSATIGGNILCENRCSFYNQSEWWREAVGYCLKCDGDICIATGGKKKCFSKFVSDTAPVLIACRASVEIENESGSTIVPLESIYTGDGVNPRNLPGTALIRSIMLPVDEKFHTVFKKLRPRKAVDFTSLTTAVSTDRSGKLRIVIGGVDPMPELIEGTLNGDPGEYIKSALRKTRVVDNDFYSREYRREMIGVYLKQSIEELVITVNKN